MLSKITKKTLFISISVLVALWFLVLRPFYSNRIIVTQPVIGPAIQAIYAAGTVEGSIMLEIRPQVTGRLAQLLTDENMRVAKGTLLAQLEDTELQATIKELEARLSWAKINNKRQQDLFKNRATSKDLLDRSETELLTAEAALAAMQAKAEYLKLLAPADCMIIRRDGELGQLMTPEQVMFWLTCGEQLRITAEVDEEDIALIKLGQKVMISADAFPDKVFSSTVSSITPRGDPISRSFRIRITLPPDSGLMIGMTVENNIIVRESSASLLVPTSSVVNNSVWLVEDGKLKLATVTIGARGETQLEVLTGVKSDSHIVVSPSLEFKAGRSVSTKLVKQENVSETTS